MVKKIILLLLLLATNVLASNYVTQASGNFADPTIWTNNCAPFLSGDTWTISEGHTVTYTNNFYTTSYWGNSVIQGTLEITNPCYMRIGGTIGGTGIFSIGTESVPIPWQYDSNETVIIQITNSSTAWIATSNIRWYGERRSKFYSMLSETAAIGTNIFWIYDPIDIKSNDVIIVSAAHVGQYNEASMHFVTNYNITSQPYYVVIGSNEFWNFGSRYDPQIYRTNINYIRTKDICALTILSRSILVFSAPFVNNRSHFSYNHNGILQGVRSYQSGAAVTGSGTNWTYDSSVAQPGLANASLGFCLNASYCKIYNSLSTGLGIQRNSNNTIMTNCIAMNSQRGFGGYDAGSYNNIMSNSMAFNGWYGGLDYYGNNCSFYNCKVYFCNYGGFVYFGSGNLFVNCESFGCTLGGFEYISSGNTFIGCTAKSNTYGIAYCGSDNTYINCTAISNTIANLLYQSVNNTLINCTNIGNTIVVNGGYGVNVLNGTWNTIQDSTSKVFYTKGGICTSQTDIVASPYGYTYKHMILDTGSENRWFESDMVRSYGSARWTVYMRMETSLTQRAYIAYEQGNYAANILAVVTNTASTGTWYTADLSWQNTSSIPVNVRLWMSAQGTSNDIAYSAAVKSDDRSLRIIP
jgi:parallel beta-helix repeat protein